MGLQLHKKLKNKMTSKKIYINEFKPLYEKGRYYDAGITLIKYPEIEECLTKKELINMLNFTYSILAAVNAGISLNKGQIEIMEGIQLNKNSKLENKL